MSDKKTPLEQALDLFVYAPLGLAMSAREELPKLAEKGRQQVTGQLTMAKMIGQFAVKQGQTEAEKAVKQAVGRLETMANRGAPEAPAPTPDAPKSPAPTPDAPKAASPVTNGTASSTSTTPMSSSTAGATSAAKTGTAPKSSSGAGAGSAARTTAPKAAAGGLTKPAGNGSSAVVAAGQLAADQLAIPGYDVLSASQVVPRLAGLSTDDLEAVRAYETATRGRKTILTRIGQLQSGSR